MTATQIKEQIKDIDEGLAEFSEAEKKEFGAELLKKREQLKAELKKLESAEKKEDSLEKILENTDKILQSKTASKTVKNTAKKKAETAKKEIAKVKQVKATVAKKASTTKVNVKELLAGLTKDQKSFNRGRSKDEIENDARVKALPIGKRISKAGHANQYGVSEGGNVYYEHRPNRSDVSTKRKPYLERGGEIEGLIKVYLYSAKKINENPYFKTKVVLTDEQLDVLEDISEETKKFEIDIDGVISDIPDATRLYTFIDNVFGVDSPIYIKRLQDVEPYNYYAKGGKLSNKGAYLNEPQGQRYTRYEDSKESNRAKPAGWRYTNAGAKRLKLKNPNVLVSKAHLEKYRGKYFTDSKGVKHRYIYIERRADKSDIKRGFPYLELGGYAISNERMQPLESGVIVNTRDTEEEAKKYISDKPDLYYEKVGNEYFIKKYNSGGVIKPRIEEIIKQKGEGEVKSSIVKSIRDLKQAKYGRDEILDTIDDVYGSHFIPFAKTQINLIFEKGGELGVMYNTLSFKTKKIAEKNQAEIVEYFKDKIIKSSIKFGTDERGNDGYQVIYYLDKDKYAKGGNIPNNYLGKTAEQVWNEWSVEQRHHFLKDHQFVLGFEDSTFYNLVETEYNKLPQNIRVVVSNHIYEGQYEDGGEIDNMDIAENSALKVYVKPTKKEGIALFKQGEAVCVCHDDDTYEWHDEKDLLKMEDGEILSEIAEDKLEGTNINVFGYQTQNFDVSEHAAQYFNEGIARIEELGSESAKESLSKAAEQLDIILGKVKQKEEDEFVLKSSTRVILNAIQLFAYDNYKCGLVIPIELLTNICSEILELDVDSEMVFEKGGTIDPLEKELHKLLKDLNSKRLSTYRENDDSEEELERKNERAEKLKRFNEVLAELKSKTNNYEQGGEMYAKGGLFGESQYNTGRSWHLDRAKHNTAEDWEKPLSERKSRSTKDSR